MPEPGVAPASTRTPSCMTWPADGARTPARISSRVVFPAPLPPATATSSPGPMDKDTSWRIWRLPACWRYPTSIEKILEAEQGRRLAYTAIGCLPVRNYRAEVTLTPAADGTGVRWAVTWDATLAGRIVRRTLRKLYPQIVAELVAAAEKQPGS